MKPDCFPKTFPDRKLFWWIRYILSEKRTAVA